MADRRKETADTVDIVPDERFGEKLFASKAPDFQFAFGAASHIGKVRSSNDDHYAVVRRRRSSELIASDLAADELVLADDSVFAMIVADGMGGSRFGEFASRLALRTMFELAQQATSWVMKLTDMQTQQIRERVSAYVQKIQETLRDYINADPALAGMGTTWTSVHLMPPYALVVHIGDSRAYLLHDGELRQLTRDETMAQALIDSGMDPDSVNKFKHVLLNSFGGETDDVAAQVRQLRLDAGDQLLLCTDGLTNMVADEQIATILQRNSDPQTACDELVSTALAGGGKDNVTVVLAAVTQPDGKETVH